MVVGEGPKPPAFKGFMSEELRMPKYEAVKRVKPGKQDSMYRVSWPKYDNADVGHKVDEVIGAVSLFAPYSHESESEVREIQLERPVTPINDEIRTPPTSFNQLVKYVRRRIAAKRDMAYLSVEDQQNLAGILMGEVNGIWREVKKQVDDPFLSAEDNSELNRRIIVYIVTVCERLFKHYLHKAVVLNRRGIFSGPANMCRLKAQLALDANKLLNILTVRRYIVADMQSCGRAASAASVASSASSPHRFNLLSFNSLMESIRPNRGVGHRRLKTPYQELQELCDQMPQLDTSKLCRLLDAIPEGLIDRTLSEDVHVMDIPSRISHTEFTDSFILEQESRKLIMTQRCQSVPLLKGYGESLKEELSLSNEKVAQDATYNIADLLTGTKNARKVDEQCVKEEEKCGTDRTSDLEQLMARSREIDEDHKQGKKDDDDLPVLLQAMTRGKKHDDLQNRLEKQMNELEEAQREALIQDKLDIKPPVHPQPATVTTKPNNQMAVKTSDIRVSERVCMSSLTLDRYATVYNHLEEEISGSAINQLDKNLFLENEIKEVYKEVMKSLPASHLDLEQDDIVMPSADKVNLSDVMPSATLNKRKACRLINPALERPMGAPWGDGNVKEWVKTPKNPPKNLHGESQFPPVTPNMDKIAEVLKAKDNNFMMNENIPTIVAEKMARTYASWFQWWKNTISTDDYLKYVSTKDTDFLGVLYHFYDPEDEGEEDFAPSPLIPSHHHSHPHSLMPRHVGLMLPHTEPQILEPTLTTKQALSIEREKKLAELKAQKSEYTEGFWNVNSVMMGGLGKDPKVEEKDQTPDEGSPDPELGRRSRLTLQARAQARRSARGISYRTPTTEVQPQSPTSKNLSVPASKAGSDRSSASPQAGEKTIPPQERLEQVWNALLMPDALRLDMAIKYSGNDCYQQLEPAILKWEQVAQLITQRESILRKLEKFERNASDPNRFFTKGHKGSSAARLDEARERSYYYRCIEDVEEDIKRELDYVKNNFNDIITYKGRPYTDKMKWDRIEMLHWLSEERKNNAIKYETVVRQIPLKPTHLDPLLLDSRG
ncbi:coiled-coil domain-containing protein 87-like [Liolophura sinensis]|uniref:coiled-coil domain-containing protein 87-like n=1 Tax=Liolophura sinensis TaxID=3198878 RepID=UPI0031598BB0